MTQAADSPNRTNAASGLRFLTELIGWMATSWALHQVGWAVAIAALVLLIGLPAVFGTPGDRPFDPPVAIPGAAMLLLVLLEVTAAAVAPWFAWPTWAAVVATALAATSVVLEQPRWRWLLHH
ncbi:hypothetical protein QMZ92_24895 [Streptomyces sp. HNM0645]|uniref:hypothetical protein n=1 Tax=Streptomyces sp. HNM0645 TaxID=2782343 RepID=UPI0024B84D5F|nr:hypothetical protein [Streptomyces sp. HNM0645]MDI9887518.1 hypothetical protein [Streptomyces sp. HNM0645]